MWALRLECSIHSQRLFLWASSRLGSRSQGRPAILDRPTISRAAPTTARRMTEPRQTVRWLRVEEDALALLTATAVEMSATARSGVGGPTASDLAG